MLIFHSVYTTIDNWPLRKVTKSSLLGQTGLNDPQKEQRDLPVRLKCVLIKSAYWNMLVLTSDFALHITLRIRIRCQYPEYTIVGMSGLFYIYLYRVWQEPFPKSDLDKMSAFPMIGISNDRFWQFSLYKQ